MGDAPGMSLGPRLIGFAGWSGAGKTTLVRALIPALNARGLVVSTIKHAHHDFDIDQPGKDSHSHRLAGAREVLVASDRRWALMHELRGAPEPSLAALLAKLEPVDLVLIEGFKRIVPVKLEIHRPGLGKPLLAREDPSIVAILSDAAIPDAPVPIVPLGDIARIADLVVDHARPIEAVR